MKRALSFFMLLAIPCVLALPLQAQVLTFTREQLIKFTEKNPFERFPDGRPKVPDQILEKVKELSAEEAWGVLSAREVSEPVCRRVSLAPSRQETGGTRCHSPIHAAAPGRG